MTDHNQIEKDKIIFLKVLRKEATQEEFTYLDRIYSQLEQQKILEELVEFSWENSGVSKINQKAYHHVKDSLEKKVSLPKQRHFTIDLFYISKVAAVFLIFSTVSFFLFNSLSPLLETSSKTPQVNWLTAKTGFGEKRIIILPDNSKIHLNYNSSLTYPENFGDEIRMVKLSGEAYFEVTHDHDYPFVVEDKQMQVKVLGTTFNFNGIKKEVALNEGKVEVSSDNEHVILTDGEKAELLNGKLVILTFDPLEYLGWKDGNIYIENKSFSEILAILEKWYGVTISVAPEINQTRVFSGNFNNKTLSNILDGLCFSLNCSFKIDNKNVMLYAKK